MKFTTTLILVVVAAALGGFIYFFESKWQTTDDVLKKNEQKRVLEDVGWNDAKKLEINTEAAGTLVLEKVKDPADWQIAAPIKFRADKTAIDGVTNCFEFLSYKSSASPEPGKPLDLALYGLDKPKGTLTIHYKDKKVILKFGSKSVVGDLVYLQVEGRSEVYSVEPALWKAIDHKLADWRDKSLARFETYEVEKLVLGVGDAETELAKKDDKWRVLRPFADPADEDQVRDLLSQVKELKAEEFVGDDVKDWAKYGLDKPTLRLSVFSHGSDKGQQLAFGGAPEKPAGLVYARNLENETVLTIKADALAKIKIDPATLRSRVFAALDPAKVNAITIERGGEVLVQLEKEKKDKEPEIWKCRKPADYPFDGGSVFPFLNRIKDMKISLFPADAPADLAPFGLDKPLGTVTVAWPGKDEKAPPEKLSFVLGVNPAQADLAYAQRAGEKRVLALPRDAASLVERGALNFRNRAMLTVARNKISALTIEDGAAATTCARGANDKWTLEGGGGEPNTAAIEDVLDNLCYLHAEDVLTDAAKDLAPYGLDKPQLKIKFTYEEEPAAAAVPAGTTPPPEKDKKEPKRVTETLAIGGPVAGAPAGKALFHAKLETQPLVFTVEKRVLDGLKKDLRPVPPKKPEGPEGPKAGEEKKPEPPKEGAKDEKKPEAPKDEKKPEGPKPEEPKKPEGPKPEPPKPDQPKAPDAPKPPEPPKPDQPKPPDAPKPDDPKPEAPK